MKFSTLYSKLTATRGLLIIVVALAALEATSFLQFHFAKKALDKEADDRARSEMKIARLDIEKMTLSVQGGCFSMAWLLEDKLDKPDELYKTMQRLMDVNPVIMNSFACFKPYYYKEKGLWFEQVLSRREGNTFEVLNLGSDDHDYLKTDWFQTPIETGEGFWSEPYFDKDGVKVMVVTYSIPLKDTEGNTVGIFGVDVSLEWLTDIVMDIQPYEHSYGTITSAAGQMIACPSDTTRVSDVLRYNSPLEGTGWKMSLVIPEDDIYSSIRRIEFVVIMLQLFGIIFIILILWASIANQKKMQIITENKNRIENELHIGRGIQMSMIPKTFPPFPERHDIDMSASIVPAKEVGGDLYDFYIRDEKLYFCIGDVSGKGVPASLVMAVTRSLFRTVSVHENSPQRIVTTMNNSMADMNESNMFVTFFIGILDLKNGHLRYCNAGHNAPFVLTDTISKLPVVPNLPLGVMPDMTFQEQETDLNYDDALFLYTDGLTEAENANHELFGEERAEAALHGRMSAQGKLESIEKAVADFVGDAPQSDDLTMLFIHYLNDKSV